MATYKFEEFNIEFENPETEVIFAGFNLKTGVTTADILLTVDGAKFVKTITGNTQPTSWTVEAITEWVNENLKQYEV